MNDSLKKRKHPILVNIGVIMLVAVAGVLICYFSIAMFTKHGEECRVPAVEKMSYTEAVKLLQDEGFRVDIRDSIFSDEVMPGYVIEQYPRSGSIVKPGRKIFLYINAVHPKEVIIDDDNHPDADALRGYPERQGVAKLRELGFKNIRVVYVLGDNDCIVKISADGQTVKKMQKVAVNAQILVEVADNRMESLLDSLQDAEINAGLRPYVPPMDGNQESEMSLQESVNTPEAAIPEPARVEPEEPYREEEEMQSSSSSIFQ